MLEVLLSLPNQNITSTMEYLNTNENSNIPTDLYEFLGESNLAASDFSDLCGESLNNSFSTVIDTVDPDSNVKVSWLGLQIFQKYIWQVFFVLWELYGAWSKIKGAQWGIHFKKSWIYFWKLLYLYFIISMFTVCKKFDLPV